MTKKRNAALDALTAPKARADVVPMPAARSRKEPKRDDDVVRVMLYLPRKVKRLFDEMAYTEDRKAHDHYLAALAAYLRKHGRGDEADLLAR